MTYERKVGIAAVAVAWLAYWSLGMWLAGYV